MANMADCAVAIAKKDLVFMNGAIKKIAEDDGSHEHDDYEYAVKSYYKRDKENNEYTVLHKCPYGGSSFYRLKKNSEVIVESENYGPIRDKIEELKLQHLWDRDKVLADKFVSNGWEVDWLKLNAYSYDSTPFVNEYEDHITIYFGGRWNFPEKLEDKLNAYGVLWQGAACEDGMDWQVDDLGNYDFGLRIGKEKSEYTGDDGEEYWQHYVEDTSE